MASPNLPRNLEYRDFGGSVQQYLIIHPYNVYPFFTNLVLKIFRIHLMYVKDKRLIRYVQHKDL